MTFNIKIWCIWTDKRWKSRGFGPRKASELGRLFIYNLTKLTDKKNMVSSQHPNHQKVPKAFRKMHVFVGKNSDFSVFTYQNCLSTKKIIPQDLPILWLPTANPAMGAANDIFTSDWADPRRHLTADFWWRMFAFATVEGISFGEFDCTIPDDHL